MDSSQLIDEVVKRGLLPTDGQLLHADDDDIIRVLTSVLQNELFPLYLELSDSYYLGHEDFEPQAKITIPREAWQGVLVDVKRLDSHGGEENIPRLHINRVNSGQYGFFMQGDELVFSDVSSFSGDKIRLYYHRCPLPLMLTSNSLLFENASLSVHHSHQRNYNLISYINFKIRASSPDRKNILEENMVNANPSAQNPLKLLFQPLENPMETYRLEVMKVDVYPQNPQPDEDVVVTLWLTPENGREMLDFVSVFRIGGYLTILEPTAKVVQPQLPRGGEALLIDKTVLQFPISDDVRSRITASLAEKTARLERQAIRRVKYETQNHYVGSRLWED